MSDVDGGYDGRPDELLGRLRSELPAMTRRLSDLVEVESPSADLAATRACCAVLADHATELLGAGPEWLQVGERQHLRWRFGDVTRVLIVGHLDTVWPMGTLAEWPFEVQGETATGPGCFDMKAGLVQGLHALTQLAALDGVTVLVTTDEELGSPTSRNIVEATAEGAEAALILEPSSAGALKTARKGISNYALDITGRAAHAGLEPERGANAGLELARQILAVERLGRPDAGTSVTPTVLSAGTTANTVPAAARALIDVRVTDPEEQQRVDDALRGLTPQMHGTSVTVSGGSNRPPLPASASGRLFDRAQSAATALGLPTLVGKSVGGGSDGNLTAAAGVPTLDGLGAVGDGAHAQGEYVVLTAMPERAALLATLVTALLDEPRSAREQ